MRYWGALVITCFLPFVSHASVSITEIMYAPEGADATHEWIEVCSSGNVSSLESWKFFEAASNHSITSVSGSAGLSESECAIIADNASVFTQDYPSFTGNLFDSAFSLSNSGETLALKNETGDIVDTVTYDSSLGGSNDGNTLHRSVETFVGATPTPGSHGSAPPAGSNESGSTTSGSTVPTVQTLLTSYETVTIQPPEDIFIRVPSTIHTTVGSHTRFYIESYDATGASVSDGYVEWSFGDGGKADGRDVSHQYHYEGSYIATVTFTRGALRDTQEISVSVLPLEVLVTFDTEGEWVSITNTSMETLDISNWRLVSGGEYFIFPTGTQIGSSSTVRFPKAITKLLYIKGVKRADLMYPDGSLAFVGVAFIEEKEHIKAASSVEEIIEEDSKAVTIQPEARASTQSIMGLSVSEKSIAKKSGEAVQAEEPSGDTMSAATQLALVDNQRDTNMYWYLGLGGLLLLGVLAAFSIRPKTLVVEGFEVIEDDKH